MTSSTKLIGKYEILAELGRGGFAVVYKARDVELDRIVALKVLHPERSYDPGFVARFKQEARAVARLRHPHIVTVFDATQIDERLIIAMQYVEGHTLRDELAQGALPSDRALTILEQIADALDYAHQQGVVHRDVKPTNILVEETGQGVHATLLDFGLVKAMEASTALTSQGTLLGSPEYMAPEQADPNRAHEISPATDRYALGIVAYQLLAGRVPFPGNTSATLNAHLNLMPPDPHTLRAEVSPHVSAILLKMLAKAPADRYASATEFMVALRKAAEPIVIHPIPRRTSRWLWGALLGLLAVLAAGVILSVIRPQPLNPVPTTPPTTPTTSRNTATVSPTGTHIPTRTPTLPAETPAPLDTPALTSSPLPAETPIPLDTPALTSSPLPSPSIGSFTVDPGTFTLGQCTTLSWQTTNAMTPIVLEVNGQTLQTNLPSFGSTSHCPTAAGRFIYSLTVTAGSTHGPVSAGVVVDVVAPTPPPQPTPSIGSTQIRSADGMTMVYVPSGTFKMGSETSDREKPVHDVTLDAFWIDRTEVTNAQYAKCVTAGQCEAPYETKSYTRASYYGNGQYDDYPVLYVNWTDADKYCTWAGGHLPTEAQWEYAARGPQGYTYPWGNDQPNDTLLSYFSKVDDTTAVGSYPSGASWVGALDLAGNVWEWAQDWYGSYPDSPQANPSGPASGRSRVLRGGSYLNVAYDVRAINRGDYPPEFRDGLTGFRCVAVRSGG